MFKSKRTSLKFHPLTSRLVQYKQLLEDMETADEVVNAQIEEILDKVKGGTSIDKLVKKEKRKRSASIEKP